MIKGFIFDMDGTVFDSTQCDYLVWKQLFEDAGKKYDREVFNSFQGVRSIDIVHQYLGKEGTEANGWVNRKEELFKNEVEKGGLQAIEGVDIFLKTIKNKKLKIALATGGSREKVNFILSQKDFKPYFDTIVTSDDVNKGKPDPELFLLAAAELAIKPDEAIVVEDAINGIEAAHKAGMKCICITSTRSKEELKEADWTVDSFSQVDLNLILKTKT